VQSGNTARGSTLKPSNIVTVTSTTGNNTTALPVLSTPNISVLQSSSIAASQSTESTPAPVQLKFIRDFMEFGAATERTGKLSRSPLQLRLLSQCMPSQSQSERSGSSRPRTDHFGQYFTLKETSELQSSAAQPVTTPTPLNALSESKTSINVESNTALTPKTMTAIQSQLYDSFRRLSVGATTNSGITPLRVFQPPPPPAPSTVSKAVAAPKKLATPNRTTGGRTTRVANKENCVSTKRTNNNILLLRK
jgi:hypothetical protein